MARCEWVCLVLSVMTLARSAWASNQFNEAGNGNLASGVNWSEGAPPLPGSQGKFTGTGNVNTFLSSDLSAGQFSFNRPYGQFNIDLQGHTLTSDGLRFQPTPFSSPDPLTTTLAVRGGAIQSNLNMEPGILGNPQPKIINAKVSDVDWTSDEWLLRGHDSTRGPGFEQTGTINVTIDQGSKVTIDRLLTSGDTRVYVDGLATELAFKEAYITGEVPQQSVGFSNIFRKVATLRAENGATIRTQETNPPIVGKGLSELVSISSFSALVRHLELDGAETRFIAPDANLAMVELDISNDAVIETNRPLYILAEVEITNATASHNLISVFDRSIVGIFTVGTGLEHKVSLNDATLNGDVDDFRFLDLNNGILNGDIQGVEAIRGEGVINGNVVDQTSEIVDHLRFLPTGLIDVNGNVDGLILMQLSLAGRPDANTPRLRVDSVDFPSFVLQQPVSPFGFNVTFDPLFRGSVGNRFELFSSLEPIFDQDPFENFDPSLRDLLEQQISQMSFQNRPAGYEFDVFVEPHAIGFTVVAVPELSTFAMLTPPLLLMAILQARRLGKQRMIALT